MIRDLPRDASVVNYAGVSYWFADGVWLERHGPALIVVAPPIGLIVPTLPAFATTIVSGGESLLYANEVYYRPRPELAGYEVVNDPAESSVGAEPAPAAASVSATSVAVAAAPIATAVPAAVAVAAPLPSATVPTVSTPYAITAAAVPAAVPPSAAPLGTSPYFPRNGQTADEQARDHYECYRFAVLQTGFDPMRANGAVSPQQAAERQSAYDRAQAACFEARGYAMR